MRGLLNLNKPRGITSRALVDRVVRHCPQTKVGHGGTLDPLASGVLLVCLGSATRLIEWLHRMPKVYRAVVRLGARSDTLDADGQVEEVPDPPRSRPGIGCSRRSRGRSARFARSLPGIPHSRSRDKGPTTWLVPAGPSTWSPGSCGSTGPTCVSYHWPHLELEIECGAGTYIRSIARNVGDEVGCGGLIEVLVRTAIGPFTLEDALDGTELSHEPDLPGTSVRSAMRSRISRRSCSTRARWRRSFTVGRSIWRSWPSIPSPREKSPCSAPTAASSPWPAAIDSRARSTRRRSSVRSPGSGENMVGYRAECTGTRTRKPAGSAGRAGQVAPS